MAGKMQFFPAGPTLDRFHESKDSVRVIIGPLGSGKTTSAINECLRLIHDMPPGKDGVARSRGAICRNSSVDLKAATIKDWEDITTDPDGDRLPGFSKIRMQPPIQQKIRYTHPAGHVVEAEVMFLGFDDPSDVKKIRGLQLTWAYVDELKEMSKSVIDMIQLRCGRYPARRTIDKPFWYGIVAASNAPARDEWLGKLATEVKPEGWGFFIQPGGVLKKQGRWVVNPNSENLQNLPENYYERSLAGKAEDWIRANLANEFVHVSNGRPVHPDFNERFHVADFDLEPAPGIPIDRGADFGRTPAAVFVQVVRTEHGRQIRVLDELVTYNTSVYTFGEQLLTKTNEEFGNHAVNRGWGDPAGMAMGQQRDETCFDVLSATGNEFEPAHTNDLEARLSTLDSLLRKAPGGEPAILISPRCQTLIKGLAGAYKFRRIQGPNERFHDKPDKGPESHVVEALHYALMGMGEGDAMYDESWNAEIESIIEEFGGCHPPQEQFY